MPLLATLDTERGGRAFTRADEPLSEQVVENQCSVLFGGVLDCVEHDLGVLGGLVRIVDAGPRLYLAAAGACVHALGVAALALFERRVYEDFYEAMGADHLAHLVTGSAVRTDRRAHRDAAMAHDFGSDESDASDIGVAVLFAEPETFGQ